MIRPLKVALVAWGVIHILVGLALIVIPHEAASIMGFGEIAGFGVYTTTLWGASLLAASIWIIVAVRDPLRHITWVKFAILLSVLGLVV